MGIARTFQSVKVFSHMTVLDNVRVASLFGAAGKPQYGEMPGNLTSILEFVGLYQEKNTLASDLTLVRQKQLEVARALATRPELLLLDETMAGLNASEVAQAMELIQRIRQNGVAVFMIEHVMKAIMNISALPLWKSLVTARRIFIGTRFS
jgi:branched-chain amino acid transport system ATP-binding protein